MVVAAVASAGAAVLALAPSLAAGGGVLARVAGAYETEAYRRQGAGIQTPGAAVARAAALVPAPARALAQVRREVIAEKRCSALGHDPVHSLAAAAVASSRLPVVVVVARQAFLLAVQLPRVRVGAAAVRTPAAVASAAVGPATSSLGPVAAANEAAFLTLRLLLPPQRSHPLRPFLLRPLSVPLLDLGLRLA